MEQTFIYCGRHVLEHMTFGDIGLIIGFVPGGEEIAKKHNIPYMNAYSVMEPFDREAQVEEIVRHIEKIKTVDKHVLIYCHYGQSRSNSTANAYAGILDKKVTKFELIDGEVSAAEPTVWNDWDTMAESIVVKYRNYMETNGAINDISSN